MPEKLDIAAFVFGAILVLVGLLAGSFKIFGAEIPVAANRAARITAFILGLVFVSAGLPNSRRDASSSSAGTTSTASPSATGSAVSAGWPGVGSASADGTASVPMPLPSAPPFSAASAPVIAPRPTATPPSLSKLAGSWRDNNGVVFNVQAEGDGYRVEGRGAGGYRSWGRARIVGQRIQWQFSTNLPSRGSGIGMLTADGREMDGTFEDSRMGTQAEHFWKQ